MPKGPGWPWTDKGGQDSWLTMADVPVIAPSTAQVAELAEVEERRGRLHA